MEDSANGERWLGQAGVSGASVQKPCLDVDGSCTSRRS